MGPVEVLWDGDGGIAAQVWTDTETRVKALPSLVLHTRVVKNQVCLRKNIASCKRY